MGTQRWAPWWIPAALGALYDIAGAPRCPFAVMEATAALARRRSDGWGPELLHDAAATREWAAAGRQATFALTVRRTPMDATGALTGAGHSTHLLETRRTTWAGAGPSANVHGCMHAATRCCSTSELSKFSYAWPLAKECGVRSR